MTFRFRTDYLLLDLVEFGLAFVANGRVYRTSAWQRDVLEFLAYCPQKYLCFGKANSFYELVPVVPLKRQLPVARKQDALVPAARLRHELQYSSVFVVRPVGVAAHHALRRVVPLVQILKRHPRPDEVGLPAHAEHRRADALAERSVRREEQVAVAVQDVVFLKGNLLDRRYLQLGQVYADTGFVILQVNYCIGFWVIFIFRVKLNRIANYYI